MNSFGNNFRISLFGESHGEAIGVVIDGASPGLKLNEKDFIHDLLRRKSGRPGTTPRTESDLPLILSGCYRGFTTGAPIAILFENKNVQSGDYDSLKDWPRPGHADFVSGIKRGGFADLRGGGHHSGRITLALIAAGVVAKKIISPISVEAKLVLIGGKNSWETELERAISEGDSLGGVAECVVTNIPTGLGEPFFDSIESLISHIIFSIPGIRGIEFGDGFAAAAMKGSEHNDPIMDKTGRTSKNGAGGINGGISNGNDILFRVAIKPTSSISKGQMTYNFATGKTEEQIIPGRHDTCFALRVPPVIEAATAIVLADLKCSVS
jgi:chorismate synthase